MGSEPLYRDSTTIILSGGKSSRMGMDKGTLMLKEQQFVEYILEVAKRMSPQVILSVGKHNKESYNHHNIPIIEDQVDEKGPIGGIVSVLGHVQTSWFFLLSIDTPLVKAEMFSELWNVKEGCDAVVFEDQMRVQPLLGLYHQKTKVEWIEALNSSRLKVSQLVQSFHLRKVSLSDQWKEMIQNVNTQQEYTKLINNI